MSDDPPPPPAAAPKRSAGGLPPPPPELLPPTNGNGNRSFVLRVAVLALAAIIAGELVITLGRGVVCAWKGGCPPEEWSSAGELLSGLLATVIALVFAILGRKP